MDKYEYNLKLEEIDKLVDQGDYAEAANLADTIDWRRVRNVRTLCLISEIYEAADRLEDSKNLLVRAYRKSPVGRNVLYRLVEVTTALQEYDEAIEYYTEYVQAAPHDNNRYILKYMIYRGRGSAPEELIAILEEYLGQEYTERWAYELAKLYQQAGQMQKCFAACDDLVLWFHSGKYVLKALELKKRYAVLTPKQQQIYEECLQEEANEYLEDPDEEDNVIQNLDGADGEVIAETIMAETEKEIAGEVAARKAQMDQQAAAEEEEFEETPDALKASTKEIPSPTAKSGKKPERKTKPASGPAYEQKDFQVGLAKSMREIISGVVKRNEVVEEDIPASVDAKLNRVQRLEMPQMPEQTVGQLSIDDILLSMGEKNQKLAAEVLKNAKEKQRDAEDQQMQPVQEEVQDAVMEPTEEAWPDETSEAPEEMAAESADQASFAEQTDDFEPETEPEFDSEPQAREEVRPRRTARPGTRAAGTVRTITQAAQEELTEAQREALQYTSNPEKLLRNKSSLPTYSEEKPEEDLGKTRRIVNTKEELMEAAKKEILAEKTIRIPTEEIAGRMKAASQKTAKAVRKEEAPYEEDVPEEEALYEEDIPEEEVLYEENVPETEGEYDAEDGFYEDAPEDDYAEPAYEDEYMEDAHEDAYVQEAYEEDYIEEPGEYEDNDPQETEEMAYEEPADGEYEGYEEGYEEDYEEEYDDEEYLMIPQHLRNLFSGFTEIEGLEDQIANAIIQAESKESDKTSRTGNILIFGAHGSGKTTLAMNIAKAIAQDKGSQVMKIAKIYAADLNRKDIAATIAKIAGGTLIIEEAGDLEPGIVEQLTTAMEFRTDGLIVILEDEQQYIHELLMRHPRFTMKFTAQIYLPVYTGEELVMFGQIYANAQDYMIGEEAQEVLLDKISALAEQGTAVMISDVIEMVGKAIHRSNKFLRKVSMGKKRYDENDYVILFPKDFK